MRYQTLDNIVRSVLMRKGYPLHWYLEALKSASDCLRELTFDSLQNINASVLPVSDTGAAELPCDYVDHVKVGVIVSQYVRPIVKRESINRLQKTGEAGEPAKYPEASEENYIGTNSGLYRVLDVSPDGENLGRQYGFNAGFIKDGYKIIRERGQIQLDQALCAKSIYLEYISDGQHVDNATKVHPYAQSTIEAYVLWQFKEHSRAFGPQERYRAQEEYTKQHRILRARMNPLTADDIKRIVNKANSTTV